MLILHLIWNYPYEIQWGGITDSYSPYSIHFAVFAVLLLGVSAAAYYRYVHKPAEIAEANKLLFVWFFLGSGLLVQIVTAPWVAGHPFDIQLFHSWAGAAVHKVSGFYVLSTNEDASDDAILLSS